MRKENNSSWVIEHFDEWLIDSIKSAEDSCDKADAYSNDYRVLLERCRTLSKVKAKFEELRFE